MNVKFSWWWLPYGVLLTFCDMWKTAGFLAVFLAFHELAHIVVAKVFRYETSSFVIYPFGFGAEIKQMGNGSIWKETLILLAGPSVHLLIPFGLALLVTGEVISSEYARYLCMLNQAICLFNLLPIYPLDGGRILQNLCQLILPYRIGLLICLIVSVMGTLWLYCEVSAVSFHIVLLFLLFQQFYTFFHLKEVQESFWWYRYLHPKKGVVLHHAFSDLFRAFQNQVHMNEINYEEEEWLKVQLEKRNLKNHKQSAQIMI